VARKSAVSRSESAAIKRLSPGSPILPLPRKALKNLFFWAGRGSPLDEFTVYKKGRCDRANLRTQQKPICFRHLTDKMR